MTLTDPDGQALTPQDLDSLAAHPRLARLVLKAVKTERGGLTPRLQALQIEAWAARLLCAPPENALPERTIMSFDLLGDLLGKARRRRLETQTRHAAQAALDAAKEPLVSAVMQTLNAIPDSSAPAQLHLIAGALLSEALHSPAVLARVPPAAGPALTAAIAQALASVPAPDPTLAVPRTAFQVAAKVAVAQAIRSLTL